MTQVQVSSKILSGGSISRMSLSDQQPVLFKGHEYYIEKNNMFLQIEKGSVSTSQQHLAFRTERDFLL